MHSSRLAAGGRDITFSFHDHCVLQRISNLEVYFELYVVPFEAGQPVWPRVLEGMLDDEVKVRPVWERVLEGMLDDEVELVSGVAELIVVTVPVLGLSTAGDAELYFTVSNVY